MADDIHAEGETTHYHIGEGSRRAQDQYVQELSRDAWRRIVNDPSYALNEDPQSWQKIRRDTILAFLIDTRRRKVSSPEFTIKPASDLPEDRKAAAIVEQALNVIPRFQMVRYNLTDADLRGSAYAMMTGDFRIWEPTIGDSADTLQRVTGQQWWMFNKVHDVDRYRFRYANKNGNRIVQFANIQKNKWETLTNPEWFIRHVYEDNEASRGYGTGLMDALYFMWYTKMIVLEIGLQGLEAWAYGRTVVKINGLREADTGNTNANVAASWRTSVQNWLKNNVLTIDSSDDVEVKDGPGTGHQMVLNFLNYCDSACCRLLLGSELPFGGDQGGGSLARAKEEGEQSDEYLQFSRDLLSDTLSTDLVGGWWRYNRQPMEAIGLGSARQPTLELMTSEQNNPKTQAEVASTLLGAGVSLKKSEVYSKTGYTVPGPEDEVIEGTTQSEAAGGFGGFGGGFGSQGFRKHLNKLIKEQAEETIRAA